MDARDTREPLRFFRSLYGDQRVEHPGELLILRAERRRDDRRRSVEHMKPDRGPARRGVGVHEVRASASVNVNVDKAGGQEKSLPVGGTVLFERTRVADRGDPAVRDTDCRAVSDTVFKYQVYVVDYERAHWKNLSTALLRL